MCDFGKFQVPLNTSRYLKFMQLIHHVRTIFFAMRFGFSQA
ncbi:hypothetical protein LC55x_4026 [Lysobacter capsici]|nr:hypothetical protein LC55x_4026 [Lysobacter capsici]